MLLGALGPTELAPVPLLALIPKVQFFLRLFALVVFLGCLATVVRYGNALKEDSDAFV